MLDLGLVFSNPVANRTVREAILSRLRSQSSTGSISVTNLVFPRQAYWKLKYPDIEWPLERRESMIAGQAFHRHFLNRVAREATVEQTLHWQGIIGRVDIYEDLPLEVKSTDTPIAPEDIKRIRPSYLEQLGIYCSMAGWERGYLLIFNRSGEPVLVAGSVAFDFLSGIRREVLRRRDAFKRALTQDDPSVLPQCPFAGTTCVFFNQGLCDCDPDEPKAFPIADLGSLTPNPDLAEAFRRRYEQSLTQPEAEYMTIEDLVRPRHAFLLKTSPLNKEEERDVAKDLRSADSYAFYKEFKRQCFAGSDYRAERKEHDGVRARIEFHDGRVLGFTKSSFIEPVKRYLITRTFKEPLLRLGFKCALAEKGRARLVVWYPNIPLENERVLVYDLSLQDLRAFKEEMERRIQAFRLAEETGDFSILPKCVPWRTKYCEYSSSCGCG